MGVHKSETTLIEDGKVTLENLPFRAGERVEVIITPKIGPPPADENIHRPLQGSILRYDDPSEPVAAKDWEALR